MGYAPPAGSVVLTPEMLNAAQQAPATPAAPAPGTSPTNASQAQTVPGININVAPPETPASAPAAPAAQAPVAPAPLTIGTPAAGTVDPNTAVLQAEIAKLQSFQAVGGEDNFNKMSAWAVTGLDEGTKKALNAALAGKTDPTVRDYMLKEVNAKFTAAQAAAPATSPLMQGQPPAPAGAAATVGISPAQYNEQYLALRREGKGPGSPEIQALDMQFSAGYNAGIR